MSSRCGGRQREYVPSREDGIELSRFGEGREFYPYLFIIDFQDSAAGVGCTEGAAGVDEQEFIFIPNDGPVCVPEDNTMHTFEPWGDSVHDALSIEFYEAASAEDGICCVMIFVPHTVNETQADPVDNLDDHALFQRRIEQSPVTSMIAVNCDGIREGVYLTEAFGC